MKWSGGIAPPFLTTALDGGEWSASRPGRFTPGEVGPGTSWIGGWVGHKAGLDAMKRKSCTPRESNPGRLARARRYTDSAISALEVILYKRQICLCDGDNFQKYVNKNIEVGRSA
jgi:hypothetical protein